MKKLIFLHGGPGFKDYLKPYFEGDLESFDLIFYDQDQSDTLKVDDLITQLDHLIGDSKAILLGHSWGGVLATEYIKRFPEKISGLILMATGLNSSQWTIYNDELEEQGLTDISKEELFFTDVEREAGEKLFSHESWGGFCGDSFDSIFESYLKSYDLLESFSKIEVPILNIYGENDRRFSKNVTTTFKSYNSKIIDLEIKNSGHFPYLLEENKEIIIQAIKESFHD